jgi:hypothetical protein
MLDREPRHHPMFYSLSERLSENLSDMAEEFFKSNGELMGEI